jgi:hypothetical protein
MFFPIENLPDETLLNIFEYLEFKDLGRCLQVSKLFRKISLDETLWQTIKTVDTDVSAEFLVQALTNGTKNLSLKSTPLPLYPMPEENVKVNKISTIPSSNMKAHGYFGDIDILEFPKQNQLKTLNLDIRGDKKIVSSLLDSCQSLEKLYLTRFSRFHALTSVFSCIFYNGQSLKVLNLGEIHLDFAGVQVVCDNCIELTELAVNLGGPGTVAYFCQNLTTKIRKLRIATARLCRDLQEQAQENCDKLSKRCNELIALSITGFDLTIIGINSIMKNLSQSLEKIRFGLDVFPWRYLELLPQVEINKFGCPPMPNLNNLYILGLQINFHPQIQQLFDKKLPNVKVMLSTGITTWSQTSAFLFFCKKHRASVEELYPNLENRQVTKILGQHWEQLTLVEKLPFSDKNDIDDIAIPDDDK